MQHVLSILFFSSLLIMSSLADDHQGTERNEIDNRKTAPKGGDRRGAFMHTADAAQQKLDITYKTTDQGPLKLDLYYPAAKLTRAAGSARSIDSIRSTGAYPLVIYTHGGGWAAGSKKAARHGNKGKLVDRLISKGFCVAAVQYRLCSKDTGTTIKHCVIDSKDALRFLAKNATSYHIDPERIFTFGDSAGGQIAQMLLLSDPSSLVGDPALADARYTMRAGVSWYGPCDFENTELFNPDGRPNFRDRFAPRVLPPDYKPSEKLRLYREVSPVNYLSKNNPPLLMVQGDGDTTIPVHHAHHMGQKAKTIGSPVNIMIIKNAGHNWRMADGKTPISPTKDDIIERSVDFLTAHCP